MKNFFLIIICFFAFVQQNWAQNSDKDSWITIYPSNIDLPLTDKEKNMINSIYDKQNIERLYSSKPLLREIKDILRNRVKIVLEINKNISKYPLLSQKTINPGGTLKKFNEENFNPLAYDFEFNSSINQIYRVDNTNYLIIVSPKKLK